MLSATAWITLEVAIVMERLGKIPTTLASTAPAEGPVCPVQFKTVPHPHPGLVTLRGSPASAVQTTANVREYNMEICSVSNRLIIQGHKTLRNRPKLSFVIRMCLQWHYKF